MFQLLSIVSFQVCNHYSGADMWLWFALMERTMTTCTKGFEYADSKNCRKHESLWCFLARIENSKWSSLCVYIPLLGVKKSNKMHVKDHNIHLLAEIQNGRHKPICKFSKLICHVLCLILLEPNLFPSFLETDESKIVKVILAFNMWKKILSRRTGTFVYCVMNMVECW